MTMKLCSEYIDFRQAYRIYNSAKPQNTIAYEEELEIAKQRVIEEGYDGLIVLTKRDSYEKKNNQ